VRERSLDSATDLPRAVSFSRLLAAASSKERTNTRIIEHNPVKN